MGCGSSVPAAATKGDEYGDNPASAKQKVVPETEPAGEIKAGTGVEKPAASLDAAKAKSRNSRARRLSYTVNPDEHGNAALPTAAEEQDVPNVIKAPRAPASARSSEGNAAGSSTRARRLSYVTNDPNAPQPILDDGTDAGAPAPAVEATSSAAQDSGSVFCTMACMSRAGREPGFKKQNQDNCFAFEKYISPDQALFGAFDGHGPNGHLVSGYVKQHLPIVLVNHLSMEREPSKALSKGFIEVDKALGSSRIDCEFSGSTSVVAFLKGRTLTTAWVGDSRGVLGRIDPKGGYTAVPLTKDHKPTAPEEMARITATNGRVERLVDEVGQPIGPYRVWLQYAWIPGLAMSRALGDVLAHQVGVISEPDCTVTELTSVDQFMILASDGVWEFVDSQQAIDIVGSAQSVEDGCRQLVDEAYQRWLVEEEGVVDDITAVVVRFNHGAAAEAAR